MKAEIDIQALHTMRLQIFGVSNKLRTPEQRAQMLPAFREQILPLFKEGKALPLVSTVMPFNQLLQAKELMDSNQHLGKIVLAGLE
jgi:NADPH:quinone reductase-like Zn-dependent oxidoreductase